MISGMVINDSGRSSDKNSDGSSWLGFIRPSNVQLNTSRRRSDRGLRSSGRIIRRHNATREVETIALLGTAKMRPRLHGRKERECPR